MQSRELPARLPVQARAERRRLGDWENKAMNPAPDDSTAPSIKEPRLWRDNGWTARVIKNNDDEGWAVEMILDGQPEPALVGPWTMGRDKKNPKPLDTAAFNTLVKTASEVIRRHEQHQHALHHKTEWVESASGRVLVKLDVVPDEDDPHAILSALDAHGNELASLRVAASFKLNARSAGAWVDKGYGRPN
jgi:hypothetical protein